MKKVEKFESDDGSLFDSIKEALKRDKLVKQIKKVESIFGPTPKDDGCDFTNGGGFYQLTQTQIDNFDQAFLGLVKEHESWIYRDYFDDPKFNKGEPATSEQLVKSYILGRCLSDSNSLLYSALWKRTCVDYKLRRWGQPFFALNPDKGTQKKLEII